MDKFRFLPVAKGHPMGSIALRSQAYLEMLNLARGQLPWDAFGALLGWTVETDGGRLRWAIVEHVEPAKVVWVGAQVLPDARAWEELRRRLAKTNAEDQGDNLRIMGWFYADPAIGIFPPRINPTIFGRVLAADGNLLLLMNPTADQGGFYIQIEGQFASVGGFYEALADESEQAVIPWNGVVSGANQWLASTDAIPTSAQANLANDEFNSLQPMEKEVQVEQSTSSQGSGSSKAEPSHRDSLPREEAPPAKQNPLEPDPA
jgi:hypothetical protein